MSPLYADRAESFVSEIFDHYREWYNQRKYPSKDSENLIIRTKELVQLICPDATSDRFGLRDMAAIQKHLLSRIIHRKGKDKHLAATTIQKVIGCIKTAFRLASNDGLCEAADYGRIFCFKPAEAWCTQAAESEEYRLIEEWEVEPVLRRLIEMYADMVFLLFSTGMRPSELCNMTWGNLTYERNTKTGKIHLVYKPSWWKTKNKTKKKREGRILVFTDEEAAIIEKYRKYNTKYIFTPLLAYEQKNEQRRKNRKSKVYGKQKQGRATGKKVKSLNEKVDPKTLGKRVKAAAVAAVKAGELTEDWTSYCLRHRFVTVTREEYGVEYTQHAAGHAHPYTQDIYDHSRLSVLMDLAEKRETPKTESQQGNQPA